jgi:hypothetical protein
MSNSGDWQPLEPPLRAAELTDTALIAALPDTGVTAAPRLAAEASRRRRTVAREAMPATDRRFWRPGQPGG